MELKVDLFSVSSTDELIRAISDYYDTLERKVTTFIDNLAQFIGDKAQAGFSAAMADDIVETGPRSAVVDVSIQHENETTLYVIASGSDAVFVEFGAGVHYNGQVGSSPNPKGAELGFTIGTYGFGSGAKDTWAFFDGQTLHSRGTPAKMPMYLSSLEARNELERMAREAFSND